MFSYVLISKIPSSNFDDSGPLRAVPTLANKLMFHKVFALSFSSRLNIKSLADILPSIFFEKIIEISAFFSVTLKIPFYI